MKKKKGKILIVSRKQSNPAERLLETLIYKWLYCYIHLKFDTGTQAFQISRV